MNPELIHFFDLIKGWIVSRYAMITASRRMDEQQQENTNSTPPTQAAAKPQSLLVPFCHAIAIYEGGTEVGTRPYRNCNPGDLRWPYGTPLPYGAKGVDADNFLIFGDYQTGFAALETMVTRCAKGYSKIYHPDMTIVQFFSVYAPSSDSNDPNKYAEFVSQHIGVEPTTYQIKNLIA